MQRRHRTLSRDFLDGFRTNGSGGGGGGGGGGYHSSGGGGFYNSGDLIQQQQQLPTRLEAALMSKYVYGGSNMNLIGGWTPMNMNIEGVNDDDPSNGFLGQLFGKYVNGQLVALTYAFAGTQDMKDGITDLLQLAGLAGQYKDAYDNAVALSTNPIFFGLPITFTGHSLGGGLAALAALATGDHAITFNAAGLSNPTMNEYGVLNRSQSEIDAVVVLGDPLNSLQFLNPRLNQAQGKIHYIKTHAFSLNPLTQHMIDTVILSLTNGYKFSLW